MQFEDFDSKLRQAADQHHPSYDEQAWAKMEKSLDQHLPLNNDRKRRIIFLLLTFLLMGGGAWMIISKPWQTSASISNKSVNVDANQKNADNSSSQAANNSQSSSTPQTSNKELPASQTVTSRPENKTQPNVGATDLTTSVTKNDIVRGSKENGSKQVNTSSPRQNKKTQGGQPDSDQATFDVSGAGASKKTRQPATIDKGNVVIAGTAKDNNTTADVASTKQPTSTTTQPSIADNSTSKVASDKKESNTNTPANKTEVAAKKAGTNKKKNYLFFSFSLGPDLSYIDMQEPGEVKLLSGAGVGYSFKDRWTIRTGFYAASKVYTANKYNYKPDNGVVNPNALDKIDANCKVYEVPLNVLYNFSRSSKHSFFASVGLSSFFMKKEVYRYLYKWPGPPPTSYTYTKTVENENQHYFSVLGLSAGYSINLNRIFSLAAEPYVKLPMSGVGYGHVKLNSMGIMFSVIAKPFH